MDRRAFTAGLTALVASAGTARADAGIATEQGALRALRLRLSNGGFQTVSGFQIGDTRQSFGVQWSQMLPVYNEDRVDLSGAGAGIGGLFRTPFRVRWARGVPIGTIDLIGSSLVGNVSNAAIYSGARVTVGAQDYSWDLPASLMATSPVQGRGLAIGSLRQGDDGRLLVSLNAQPVV